MSSIPAVGNLVIFAIKPGKVAGIVIISLISVGILIWLLRSLGIDRNSPPDMIWRKIRVLFLSYFGPIVGSKKWKEAERLEKEGKYSQALKIYFSLLELDAFMSSSATLAVHNDTVLEKIEEICEKVGYPFPEEQLSRLREDIYDYYLVKQKVLSPSEYDSSLLNRPENEARFEDKISLVQEKKLIDNLRDFLSSFIEKVIHHIESGAPPIQKKEKKPELPLPEEKPGGLPLPSNAPFQQSGQSPLGEEPSSVTQPPISEPALSKSPFPSSDGAEEEDEPLRDEEGTALSAPPPPPEVAKKLFSSSSSLFSAEEKKEEADDPFAKLLSNSGDKAEESQQSPQNSPQQNEPPKISPPPTSQSSAQISAPIPSNSPESPNIKIGGQNSGAPQPTGGFPGIQNQNSPFPQPTGGFPGVQNQNSPFPQPTGGFPGVQNQGARPQPTGGFPGIQNQNSPFPQPTGGFPGIQNQNSPFPQPTGGFPGMTPAPNPNGNNRPNAPANQGGSQPFGGPFQPAGSGFPPGVPAKGKKR